jgi:hypothetical protein
LYHIPARLRRNVIYGIIKGKCQDAAGKRTFAASNGLDGRLQLPGTNVFSQLGRRCRPNWENIFTSGAGEARDRIALAREIGIIRT